MTKRKKGGLAGLGNSFTKKEKRRGKRGMADVMGRATGKGNNKKSGGLGSGIVAMFDRKNKPNRSSRMEKNLDAAELLKRKMTKTEYLETKSQAEQAVENDDTLRSSKTDHQMIGQQGFFQRLLAIIRRVRG
jgi:hypothetical protein